MALFLALDTATDRPTFALGHAADPGAEIALEDRRELSRSLDRVVRDLMQARQVTPRDLAGIVVADGPGSFTGLRIGIAFAKGLCRALGLPLLTAPSMLGAACAAGGKGDIVVEYDALRGAVYRAHYRFAGGGVTTLLAPVIVPADAERPAGTLATERQASARSLLKLRAMPDVVRTLADPATWEPEYGRPAEAEARRKAHAGR